MALLVGAGFVFRGPRVDALNADRSLSQYLRTQWGPESGFPGGPVYSITQTADGYLWIGAEKGLVRFDGLTFRLFEPGTSVGAGPAVLGVTAAPDGSLWARLRGIALLRFYEGAFRSLLGAGGVPESVVSALVRGPNDDMLLATLGQGAMRYRDGRVAPVAAVNAIPGSSFVIAIAEGSDGDVWLGTRDAGLLRVQGDRITRLTEGLPDLKVNCLLAGENGEVWIGTDKGVARWTGSTITQAGIPTALQSVGALHMMRDTDATVWIAAGARGLLRADRQGSVRFAAQELQTTDHVAAVFEDRDGNLWVGTDRGIERWRDPVFTTYSTAQGLIADAIGPVYAAEDGRVWFAPSRGGLFWVRDGTVARVTAAGIDDDVVYSIDGGGDEVWVGRRRGGLTRLRVRGDAIEAERFTHRDGLAQDNVFAVHHGRDGTVWAGTLSAGASLFKHGRFASYDVRHGLASNTVAAIAETNDGTIWFATPTGLSALSRGGWRTYTANDGLPSNDINTLYVDHAGVLWIGTPKGIAVAEAGRLRTLAAISTALRASILGFAEDYAGSLWVNTAERVVRVDREGLLHGLSDGNVREYGVADGLRGLESAKRHRTLVPDSRGRIWFSTTRGLSMADPARAERHAMPSLIRVEEITADGVAVDLRRALRIPSNRRRITLTYAGLSLSVPERVRFRYRLDGFDNDWNSEVADRQAVYTNLAPGSYRFRVIASNSDGLWNSSEAAMSFTVAPMFWETAWFQAALVLLAGVAGWGVYRLRMHQLARQLNMRFEERLSERTHIAQELHDTLLQGFVSASMQLHVEVDRLPDDSPSKRSLGRVLDLMGRVIDEGRNAVRGLRSPSRVPHELERAFAEIQHEVSIGNAAYRVILEGRSRPLRPVIRDEVYRIGREALVNAFRHSGAASVEIELEYSTRELRVFVRDDGRGVAPEVLRRSPDGHWGIRGMRERAVRIGGTLKIRSRSEAGTEVELIVPAHVAFDRDRAERRTAWLSRVFRRAVTR